MPSIGPIKRSQLIRYLRELGFDGPFPRTRHAFLRRGELKVTIPNEHTGDISRPLLLEILRQAGVSREEWERL